MEELSIVKKQGLIVFFGSGEISPSGRRVYDWVMNRLSEPIRVAILETPAGFQPNSAVVAGKVGDFLSHHLQNYRHDITVIPARKRGIQHSPDNEDIVSPIINPDIIFLGPDSPTYTIRQLQDSITWHTVLACNRQGSNLVLASAATIAASNHALPVYEIYKAGEDLYWHPGLDLFGPYGLSVVFVPHWNNREGGAELDTSCCFMGKSRFEQLQAMLPSDVSVVGIDEHTALVMDIPAGKCHVLGRGTVTLLQKKNIKSYASKQVFSINELGPFHMIEPECNIPSNIWERVLAGRNREPSEVDVQPTPEVCVLVQNRALARTAGDWNTADELRRQLLSLGWQVNDTPDGPQLIIQDK